MAHGSRVARIGRYRVLGRLASGGMGTVHLARQIGDAGFARMVAIKFLHPHLATVPEFVVRFLDEARLAARIRHANVVATVDVVQEDDTLCLVMEYIPGESVSALVKRASEEGERVPPPVAIRIMIDTLQGLHAAHTATDDRGSPLVVVHRDVSPQNILVGLDGAAHLLDFGIAKAASNLQTTTEGQLKGKLRYMAPEQIVDREATARSDIYAASVVLWELLAGRKLFDAVNDAALLAKVLEGAVLPPSHFGPGSPELDAVVLRGLGRDPATRPATAEEMANELERVGGVTPATVAEVAAWVERLAGASLRERETSLSAEDDRPSGERTTSTMTAVATATPEVVVERTALLDPDGVGSFVHAPAGASDGGKRRQSVVIGASAFALVAIATIAVAAPRALRRDPTSPGRGASAPSSSTQASTIASADSPPAGDSSASISASSTSAPAVIPSFATSSQRRPPSTPRIKDRATKPDCTPPYYRDESGIRRLKRECL